MRLIRILAAGLAAMLVSAAHAAAPSRVLDDFSTVDAWQAQASDGVLSAASAANGGLRLDFDFAGKGGYAFVRRALPIDLPDNYEISFYVRADAPVNHFEFKLTDASGDNVWWFPQQNYSFPKDWQLVRIKKRQMLFAWGPTKDRVLKHADRIEFVVSAGSGGGKGSIQLRQLTIRPLPPVPDTWPKPVARASSQMSGGAAALAVDGNVRTAWVGKKNKGKPQRLTIDLGAEREFGGVVLHWLGRRHASDYDVELSSDGGQWRTVRHVAGGNGGDDPLRLQESEARYVRLVLRDGPAAAYALAEVDVKDLAWGATPNQFIEGVARDARRGLYPRGFSGQQSYWTLVGVDGGGDHSALISEDGALESKQGGFSVEPFVRDEGRLVGWADVEVSQSLRDGYLPIPTVMWRHPGWTLSVTAAADGTPASSRLLAKYELKNLGATARRLQLVLAVRPFQVNAPRQFLNTPGGFSAIQDLRWDGREISVNGENKILPLQLPAGVELSSFDGGLLPGTGRAASSAARQLHDETGMASAALTYDLVLPPYGGVVIGAVLPMANGGVIPPPGQDAAAWLIGRQDAVAEEWRDKLNRVALKVPAAGRHMADTLRSSLAHMLMTREGASLQPGTRSYRRSWIRDGAMMSEALLRLGQAGIAADYLRWYAPYQFDNGKVPCCVDRRGADPVPENDSHGQLIFLAAELYRYTQDKTALANAWPRIDAAARYMESLRQSERVAENLTPERRAFHGLMPASISHEGYSEKPMHSYWDDFWAMRGYKDAADIATVLGHADAARRLEAQRDEFRHDLYASLAAATGRHGIDYIPGAAELGDFDPTSSTIALTPGGEQGFLPPAMLKATYDKYWDFFLARRDGRKAWEDYTPYELRNVSAFVRLGWRERAARLLDYFYADQRPAGWNQWAEVVGRDMREPRFVGDMPHGWISSDYIRAALDSFAYEREADHALLLAEGVPLDWLRGDGIGLQGLRTPYGSLSYTLAAGGGTLSLGVDAMPRTPPGGVVLTWPWDTAPGAATLNGRPVAWRNRQIHIDSLPAVLKISGAPF